MSSNYIYDSKLIYLYPNNNLRLSKKKKQITKGILTTNICMYIMSRNYIYDFKLI